MRWGLFIGQQAEFFEQIFQFRRQFGLRSGWSRSGRCFCRRRSRRRCRRCGRRMLLPIVERYYYCIAYKLDPIATYLVVDTVEMRLEIVVAGSAVVDDDGAVDSGCSPMVANKSFTFGRITAVAPGAVNGFAAAL